MSISEGRFSRPLAEPIARKFNALQIQIQCQVAFQVLKGEQCLWIVARRPKAFLILISLNSSFSQTLLPASLSEPGTTAFANPKLEIWDAYIISRSVEQCLCPLPFSFCLHENIGLNSASDQETIFHAYIPLSLEIAAKAVAGCNLSGKLA